MIKEKARKPASVADKLKQRGILTASQANKCRIVGNTLEIPLFDINGVQFGTRVKTFTESAGQKYFWKPSRPDHELADWYILPTAIQAIQDNNGVCYLANGEPATLALCAASLYNTICTTLSEISVPNNIVSVLERLGITELRYLMDSDDAGLKSAIKWRDTLLTSDIEFKAYKFPEHLGDKADANDLWIDCGFDIDKMQTAIANLERAILPQPEVKEQKEFDSSKFDKTPDGLVQALLAHYGKKHFISPFRIDNNPTVTIHPETGFGRDWGTGDWHHPIKMAKNANIDWRSFYPKSTYKPKNELSVSTEQLPEENPYKDLNEQRRKEREAARQENYLKLCNELGYDPALILYDSPALPGGADRWVNQDDLPVALITAILLLSGGRSVLPLVFVKMHQALSSGRLSPQFTIKQVAALTQCSRQSISKILDVLSEWGFVKKLGTYSIYNKESIISSIVPPESLQNSPSGRPVLRYGISQDWHSRLYKAIETYYIEKYFSQAVTIKHQQLLEDLNLDEDDAEAFKNRAWAIRSEPQNAEANKAFKKEMYGDGHNWHGWDKALASRLYFEIDWRDVNDMKTMRAEILRHWVSEIRTYEDENDGMLWSSNTRDELQRLLGCSDTTVTEVCSLARVHSASKTVPLTLDTPDTVRKMQALFFDVQRSKRAKCWQIKFKDEDGWISCSEHDYLKTFANGIHRYTKVLFILNMPSTQRILSHAEINLRLAKQDFLADLIEILAYQVGQINFYTQVVLALWVAVNFEIVPVEAVSNSHKTSESYESNETYLNHSERFKVNQLRLHTHVYTHDLKLWPSLHLVRPMPDGVDGCAELVKAFTSLKEVATDLNKRASATPLRTVKSFYGGDYDEEIDIRELEKEAAKRMAWAEKEAEPVISILETPEPEQKVLEMPEKVVEKIDIPEKAISETERKRRETLRLLQSKSWTDYQKQKVGA